MIDKKKLLKEWLQDKKDNTMFILMCYACISFKKQRNGVHNLCLKLSKVNPTLYHSLNTCEDIVCGWADELTTLVARCYPDFEEKFGRGITIRECEEIICEEINLTWR